MSSAFSVNCVATKVESLKSMFLVTLDSISISVSAEYSSCPILRLWSVMCKLWCFLRSLSLVSYRSVSVSVLTRSSPSLSFRVSLLKNNSSYYNSSLSFSSEWYNSKLSFFFSLVFFLQVFIIFILIIIWMN